MTTPTTDPFQPTPRRYVRQLARSYRFFERYVALRDVPHHFGEGTSFNDLEDNMWAFFMNCWHVADWIKNDPDIDAGLRQQIGKDVSQAPHLTIVCGLANGTKHSRIDSRQNRTGARQSIIRFAPRFGGGYRVEHIVTLNDGRELQALELGQKALAEWRDILQRHGLDYFDEPKNL